MPAPRERPAPRRPLRGPCCALLLALCGAALPACKRPAPPPAPAAEQRAPLATPEARAPSRCDEPGPGASFSLGEDRGEDDDALPFSVEVGDGVAFADGFAFGALTPNGHRGAEAVVVTTAPDGSKSRIVSLGMAHGDTPPPRVAAGGGKLFAALLESGASNRRLRLAQIDAGQVNWGPGFDQGRDESLAFDVAVGDPRSLVAWDDDARDPERGVIRVATFTTASFASPTAARVVSPKSSDAEGPRVVARPGGFWIFWIARRPEPTDDEAREVGESAEFRWLEAAPLDLNGANVGAPRRITPEKGHVLTYDVEAGEGGTATAVYRDDDTPSGSAGGVVLRVVVRPDGSSEPAVIADRNLGIGAPTLLPGWLAIADATDETRLARMAPSGELLDRLESEQRLGRGEPIAADGDRLLVARPRGLGVRLFVTRCHASDGSTVPPSSAPSPPPLPPADPPIAAP